jgi:carboxyl-terminal processing protease
MNKIRPFHRLTLFVAAIAMTVLVNMPAGGASQKASDQAIERWAEQVWQSALRGDRASLDRYLNQLPVDGVPALHAERFRESLQMRQDNQQSALADQVEAREKAHAELQQHLEDGDLSKALRSAVEVQTLSDDFDLAFDDPAINKVIEWAAREIPIVKEDGDWLRAQELLFRLRTLYDDTSRYDEYRRYDEQLEQVNRRVSLLSRYAPRMLHELRNRSALRLGEEPLGEFNPANTVDLNDRLSGINGPMVRQSLRTAASEHIESEGWRPLFEGGLDALRLVGTTELLSETFPALGDADRVNRWARFIDQELADLAKMADGDLDAWAMNRLLERIETVNSQTINLPDAMVLREFGDGAMHRLDQFSEIIWPDNLRRFRQATEGNFVGVGILIRHNDKREIVVINPLEGTPAYFAGIKPEDVIVQVNGEATVGWSLNDAVDEITGPKGVPVKLSIKREGESDLLHFEIVRDTIKMLSVKGWWKTGITDDGDPTWDWFVDPDSRIAYIRLTSFNEDSYQDLRRAWREINENSRANGLILDLRYNPGGLLTSAVQISNMFLRSGVIVSGENKDGIRAWPDQRARRTMAELADVPTVVLINKGSASGSEIVAGALQAHGAAVIVGERTYGKGSVQTVHQVAANAALKLTTQYYRLPAAAGEERGRLVHRRPGAAKWGVDPDIEVTMSPSQFEQWYQIRQQADILPDEVADAGDDERPDINDLLTKGLDPQLETALLILQARTLGVSAREERHAARD